MGVSLFKMSVLVFLKKIFVAMILGWYLSSIQSTKIKKIEMMHPVLHNWNPCPP
jgi:hypothetical protein